MSNQSLDSSLAPTESLELENSMSLVPRVKLILTIHRSDKSVAPIDEWQVKRSLIDYLRSSFSITVPEDDLQVKGFKDLKKRKREDPVAHGILFIRDLGFLSKASTRADQDNEEEDAKVLEKKFREWKKSLVEKMDGIELNLEGFKFKLTVTVPASDDFDGMRKEWEELYAFSRGYSRSKRQQPDTIILRGAPSRWFSEPRVSSKPSMLVTHTIFSAFGKIRNLDVAEDDDIGKLTDEDRGDIVSGLQCKIVVRFEKHKDFYNALKVLCGRSLQKQGSQLKADYEVTWDKDRFFGNASIPGEGSTRWTPATSRGDYRKESLRRPSQVSHFSPDGGHPKRFKE